jgi:hypothetical protein
MTIKELAEFGESLSSLSKNTLISVRVPPIAFAAFVNFGEFVETVDIIRRLYETLTYSTLPSDKSRGY